MSSPAARSLSLERLRALLLDEGGLMASLVTPAGNGDGLTDTRADPAPASGPASHTTPAHAPGPAQIVASGPRAEGHREDYELLIEAIYEGYLLHYGAPRVALTSDRDLALLAGDRLYALGLAHLVSLGDTEAVVELADTITLSALAQGAGAPELAGAVWAAGARALGWGSTDAHRRAKDLMLAGDAEAIEAMRTICEGPPPTPFASP